MANKSLNISYYWCITGISILSFLVNMLVSAIFFRFRKKFWLRESRLLAENHNKLLLSLTLADLFVSFSGILSGVLLLTKQDILIYKIFGTIPLFGSMFISIFSLTLLTMDRLLAVKRPLQYDSLMNHKTMLTLVFSCWIIPIFITIGQCLLILISNRNYNLELDVRASLLGLFFVTGFLVLVVSNGILFFSLRKRHTYSLRRTFEPTNTFGNVNKIHPAPGETVNVVPAEQVSSARTATTTTDTESQKVASNMTKLDYRICLLCISIVLTFLFCWLPLTTYRLSSLLGRTESIVWFRRLSMILAIANSLIDPFLYFLIRRDFRYFLRRMFFG